MSICRKREKNHVSIRTYILILVLLTIEVHSGEGSDNYPGWFKQKKGTEEYALPNMTTCSSDFMERPNKEFKLLQTD